LMGCRPSVPYAVSNSIFIDVIILEFYICLVFEKKNGVSKLMYIETSEMYGG